MGGSPTQNIIVTEYRLGIHFGVCHGPVDALTGIYVGDKLVYAGSIYEGTLELIDVYAFGGYEKEGGIKGNAHILSGKDTQMLPAEVAARLGGTPTTLPGFRGLFSVFFKGLAGEKAGFYWSANSPYIKNPAFRVKRMPKGWYAEKANIGNDANPAHLIYECLTNTDWGMGGSPSSIDLDALKYAADVFHSEGLGLSMLWTGQSTIESFIQEVLDHVEATFFLHPRTGLLTIKPIRQDFDVADLYHLTKDNCVVISFQRKGWGETTNEINASWTNPVNEQEENVTVHSLGNIAAQGSISSDSRNYYGARSSELALRLATRDLNAASYPLASADVETDRSAWDKVPGEVVKLSWDPHGLAELPMRVVKISYGRAGRSKIVVSLVEDVFALPSSSYVESPETGWEDPTNPPEPLAYYRLSNAPYFMISRIIGDAASEVLPYPQQYAFALASQNKTDTIAAEMFSERINTVGDTVFERVTTISLSSHAELSEALTRAATSNISTLNNFWGNISAAVGVLVQFGSGADTTVEWAVVSEVTDGIATLRRGILDTVPRAWPSGTEVWLFRPTGSIYDPTAHSLGDSVPYKLLSRTSAGILDEDLAPLINLSISDRLHLPSRPANVRVNGTLFGPASATAAQMTAGLLVQWSLRNRLTETSQILAWTDAGVAAEVDQTTTVIVRSIGGAVLETAAGLTGSSYTTTFLPASVTGGGIIIEVFSVRDGLESLQRFTTQIALV